MSSAARRLSNSMETLISAMISAGPPAKRPPHILLVPMNFLKRPVVLAAAAIVVVAAAAIVLYVKPSGPVHAPPSIAALISAKTPAAVPDAPFIDGVGKRHML